MVKIRNYQTSDFQQVKEILEKSGLFWELSDNQLSLERKVQKDPESILVAVENERVVGTQFLIDDFFPFLFRLAVHPDYRGRDIAIALGKRAEDILKARGASHINILVAQDDERLQKIYERQGYERGNTYRWMVKEL